MSLDRSYEDDFIVEDDVGNTQDEPPMVDAGLGESEENVPLLSFVSVEMENDFISPSVALQERPPSASDQMNAIVASEDARSHAHLDTSVSYGDDFDEVGEEVENEAVFVSVPSPSIQPDTQEGALGDASVIYGYDFDTIEPSASQCEPLVVAADDEPYANDIPSEALPVASNGADEAAGEQEVHTAVEPIEFEQAIVSADNPPSPRPALVEEGDGSSLQEMGNKSSADLLPHPLPPSDSTPAEYYLADYEPQSQEGLPEESLPLAAEINAEIPAESVGVALQSDEIEAPPIAESQALDSCSDAAIAIEPPVLPPQEQEEEQRQAEELIADSFEPPQQPLEEMGSKVFYDAVFQDQTRVVDAERVNMPQRVPFASSAVDEAVPAVESNQSEVDEGSSSDIPALLGFSAPASPRMDLGRMNSMLSVPEDPIVAQYFQDLVGDMDLEASPEEPLPESAEGVVAKECLVEEPPLSESSPLRPVPQPTDQTAPPLGERFYELSADSQPVFELLEGSPGPTNGIAIVSPEAGNEAFCLPSFPVAEPLPYCDAPAEDAPRAEQAPSTPRPSEVRLESEAPAVVQPTSPADSPTLQVEPENHHVDDTTQDAADQALPPSSEVEAVVEPETEPEVAIDPEASSEPPQAVPIPSTAPRKITLDMLERYVEPQRPRSVNNLRNSAHNNREVQKPKSRPKSAAAAVSSSSGPTFLTGLNEAVRPIHSQTATQLPVPRARPTSSPTRANKGTSRPASPSRGPIRYCHAIRFNVESGCLVLSDICPHRREFTKCRSTFCQEALEKSEWLNLMRRKSKDTEDLVVTVDRMWRLKLHHALDQAVEEMRRVQAREMSALKKKLQEPNTQEKHLKETLKYLRRNGAHARNNEELYLATGLTSEHYEFVNKQVEIHQDHSKTYIKSVLDQHRAAHAKALEELKQSIETPLHLLDSTRGANLETVDFHMKRVERMILYVLELTVAPSKLDNMRPPDQDVGTVARVRRASKQVTEVLRTALSAFAHLCSEIRRLYGNADQEVRRMLQEARSARFQARPSSPSRAQSRGASAKRKASAKTKVKADQRPSSAPPAASMRLSQGHLQLISMTGDGGGHDGGEASPLGSYDSDFEELPRAGQIPQKISRATTATSIPEAVEGEELDAPAASYSVAETEVEEDVHDNVSPVGQYEDDFVNAASIEIEAPADQRDASGQEADIRNKPSRSKGKRSKRRKEKLPVGSALKDELAVAKLQDNKLNRKSLLNELIKPSNDMAPKRVPSPKRMSRLRSHLQHVREQSSSIEVQQGQEMDDAARTQSKPCFHCNQLFYGKGKTMPRLSDQAGDSWQRAQEDAARSRPRLLDPLKRVRLGADVFDLSKTFLAKLQLSAERIVDGDPVFCSWLCVKKWAIGSCPIQHRYQTEMLINMAAGTIVEG